MMGENIIPEAGAFHILGNNPDPTVTRNECDTIIDYHNTTFQWTSEPCFVNAGSTLEPSWQPWIVDEGLSYNDDEYRIGNSMVGYSIWKSNGTTTYYDSTFDEIKVRSETWKVFFDDGVAEENWVDTGIDQATPSFSYTANNTHSKVTVTKTNDDGTLKVEFILAVASPVKHDVYWTNDRGSTQSFKVVQEWDDIVGAESVLHLGGTTSFGGQTVLQEGATGYGFVFLNSTGGMIVKEDQLSASDKYTSVLLSRNSGKEGAEFHFDNSTGMTLAQGATLLIDPTTLTIQKEFAGTMIGDPNSMATGTHGGYLDIGSMGNKCPVGMEDGSRSYTCLMQFDISGIDDGAYVSAITMNVGTVACYSGSEDCHVEDASRSPPWLYWDGNAEWRMVDDDTCSSNNDGDTGLFTNAEAGSIWLTQTGSESPDDWENGDITFDSQSYTDLQKQLTAGTKYAGTDTDKFEQKKRVLKKAKIELREMTWEKLVKLATKWNISIYKSQKKESEGPKRNPYRRDGKLF